jgi:hypothetical protein
MYYPKQAKPKKFSDICTLAIYGELLTRTVQHVPNFLGNLESRNPATKYGVPLQDV